MHFDVTKAKEKSETKIANNETVRLVYFIQNDTEEIMKLELQPEGWFVSVCNKTVLTFFF